MDPYVEQAIKDTVVESGFSKTLVEGVVSHLFSETRAALLSGDYHTVIVDRFCIWRYHHRVGEVTPEVQKKIEDEKDYFKGAAKRDCGVCKPIVVRRK